MKRLMGICILMAMGMSAFAAKAIPPGGEPAISTNLPADLQYRGEMSTIGTRAVQMRPEKGVAWSVVLKTTKRYGNFWSSVVSTPNTVDLKKGDVLLLSFRARAKTPVKKGRKARMMTYFEIPAMNNAKPLRSWTEVGEKWQQVFYPFMMSFDAAAGKAFLAFGQQDGPQEIEIADIQLLTYGKKVDMGELPVSAAAGRPGNPYLAPWYAIAGEWQKRLVTELKAQEKTMFDTLHPTHPRIILKQEDTDRLKKIIAEQPDSMPAKYYPELLKEADSLIGKPALSGIPTGSRKHLLTTSRKMLRYMEVWGLAWRLSGDEKYAARAKKEMLNVASFETWHPSHFLDVAEMTNSMAIGYDWFYEYLDPASRDTIRKAIVETGLKVGLAEYARGAWWPKCDHNWNLVCNFGLTVGALAVADTDSDVARDVITRAIQCVPRAMAMYGPEGAWTEGPGYWDYATRYTLYGLASLESALGNDFGVSKFPGFAATGQYPIYTAGPTGYYMCFADCGRGRLRTKPLMFYFARRFGDTTLAHWEYAQIEKHGAKHQHLMYYIDPPTGEMPALDLDRKYEGPVPVATFRGKWGDRDALFVGVKGGYNRVNHGHLDLGNFELDALGERWALDLGGDSYSLPNYFSGGVGAKRWEYYRLNSHSHNVPEIGGEIQHPEATAAIKQFVSHPDSGFAVVDLTEGYKDQAICVIRGVAMLKGRRSVLIQDEFDLKDASEIAWGLTTMATLDLTNPREVRLTRGKKALKVRLLSPEGAMFCEESAEQQPPQKTNKGVHRLVMRYNAPKGKTAVRVQFVPEWPDGTDIPEAPNASIDTWK